MKPRYSVERWPHGWLICGAPGTTGVPMEGLGEISRLFPKSAIMDSGIPHHFHAIERPEVVFCVALPADAAKWRVEIDKEIASLPPQARWWRGLDVGMSAAALFGVFCDPEFRHYACAMGNGSVPRDAADLGRCLRLLKLFPAWRQDMQRVAAAYPDTRWPELVEKWSLLESADAADANRMLQ